jgi:predicted RNA-binding Zn-ribbon protein involved in translation (DUF1610 family)
LYRDDGWTLEEVGARFGVTRERIRQIFRKMGVSSRGAGEIAANNRRRYVPKPCPSCGVDMPYKAQGKTCSVGCAAKLRTRELEPWERDAIELIRAGYGYSTSIKRAGYEPVGNDYREKHYDLGRACATIKNLMRIRGVSAPRLVIVKCRHCGNEFKRERALAKKGSHFFMCPDCR